MYRRFQLRQQRPKCYLDLVTQAVCLVHAITARHQQVKIDEPPRTGPPCAQGVVSHTLAQMRLDGGPHLLLFLHRQSVVHQAVKRAS
jgi:hypothetical protein